MRHAALLACEHDPRSAPPEPPCIVHSLPELQTPWEERAECGLASLARGRLELELTCARLGGFPCRILASYIERGTFAADESARIPALMRRACSGGDDDACGDHATVEETFHP